MELEELKKLKVAVWNKITGLTAKIITNPDDLNHSIYESQVDDLRAFDLAIDNILFSLYDYTGEMG